MIETGDFVVPVETPNTHLSIVVDVNPSFIEARRIGDQHLYLCDPDGNDLFRVNHVSRQPRVSLIDTLEFWYYRLTGKY